MDEITLRNFRCFRDEQTVRLAPLTLLVGENSTGKTSFMAMVRALWELAFHDQIPDFKDPPYDLGSFDEIAHHRGARGSRAEEIFAAFKIRRRTSSRKGTEPRPSRTVEYRATFRKRGTAPFPVDLRLSGGQAWVQYQFRDRRLWVRFGTKRGSWKAPGNDYPRGQHVERTRALVPFRSTLRMLQANESDEDNEMETIRGEGGPGRDDCIAALACGLLTRTSRAICKCSGALRAAAGPMGRERPRRRVRPMYLASMILTALKARLEAPRVGVVRRDFDSFLRQEGRTVPGTGEEVCTHFQGTHAQSDRRRLRGESGNTCAYRTPSRGLLPHLAAAATR